MAPATRIIIWIPSKTDLEEWDSSFREANALYQKLAKLQKLHDQYQAGQVVLNSDDNVHADLQKMIDNKKDTTARHLATVVKKAKTDRDHNRSGTTKLRLELARAQTASKGTKKKGTEIKKVGDQILPTLVNTTSILGGAISSW